MSQVPESRFDWTRLAAELDRFREEEKALWGSIDDMMIARYFAGTCSATERDAVDSAARSLPAVQQLLDTLRPILAPAATKTSTTTSRQALWRLLDGIHELVEPLGAWVDAAGKAVRQGLDDFQVQPAFTGLGDESEPGSDNKIFWQAIPLEGQPFRLSFSLGAPNDSGMWALEVEVSPKDQKPSGDLVVLDSSGEEEVSMSLEASVSSPILLRNGQWGLLIEIDGNRWKVPLTLGADDRN